MDRPDLTSLNHQAGAQAPLVDPLQQVHDVAHAGDRVAAVGFGERAIAGDNAAKGEIPIARMELPVAAQGEGAAVGGIFQLPETRQAGEVACLAVLGGGQ